MMKNICNSQKNPGTFGFQSCWFFLLMNDGEIKCRRILLISTIKIAILATKVLKKVKTADSTEGSSYPAATPLGLQPEF